MTKDDYHYKKIAYLGYPGSNSYLALLRYFGKEKTMISCANIKSAIQKAASDCDAAVVPIENSTTGAITETYDTLLSTKLAIRAEIILRIHHQILTKNNHTDIKHLKKIYSHPQVFSQCETFLEKYKNLIPIYTSDTAQAAKIVANESRDFLGAIANYEASKLYKLHIIAKNIENNKQNLTRFVIIAKRKRSWGQKVSIAFSLAHKPGSLFTSLAPFAKRGINLTKIESRPLSEKKWEYIFFVDFEINQTKATISECFDELKRVTNFIHIFGFYSKGITYES